MLLPVGDTSGQGPLLGYDGNRDLGSGAMGTVQLGPSLCRTSEETQVNNER